jgi:hypothetical protein
MKCILLHAIQTKKDGSMMFFRESFTNAFLIKKLQIKIPFVFDFLQ